MASAKQHLRDSLICPICRGLLTKPKILPCSHTFCEDCLTQVHSAQARRDQIPCPVCRSVAPVSYNNVSNFPTNQIAKSLAQDFKERSDKKRTTDSTGQRCTLCDADDQGLATFYCQYCSEFLCDSCLEQHKRFKKYVIHELVSARDIASGKIRIQLACPEHSQELQQFVCATCLVRICCRCVEVGHQPGGHEVIGIEEYEESHKAAVDLLQEKIEQKTAVIQSHSSVVKEQIGKVETIIGQRRQEIENVFKGALKRIRQRKDQLLEECNAYERSLCKDLEGIIQCNDDFLQNLSAKVKVVTEETTSQRKDQSLPERVARVGELEALVKGDNPDASLAESISLRAEFLTFHQAAEVKGLDLGAVKVKGWELRETEEERQKRVAEGFPSGLPGGFPGGFPEDMPGGFPGRFPFRMGGAMPRGFPGGMGGRMPGGFPGGMPGGFPGRMGGSMPGGFPGGMDGRMPEGFPGGMPGGFPRRFPGRMGGGAPGGFPGGMGGRMPGGFPGGMVGGMPGGFPGGMAGGMGGGVPGGIGGLPCDYDMPRGMSDDEEEIWSSQDPAPSVSPIPSLNDLFSYDTLWADIPYDLSGIRVSL